LQNYNCDVARGWESKSVEAQQAEAIQEPAPSRPQMSGAEASLFREKENLRLARQRVLRQLGSSLNPRHRQMLQDALADLDQKLSRLES
jgi:hypothetical protein